VRRTIRWAIALGALITATSGLATIAQPTIGAGDTSGASSASSSDNPPGVPSIAPPPDEPTPDANNAPAHRRDDAAANSLQAKGAPPPKPALPPPPAPPPPVRSPAAVLQALDKVTAETLRFAVPIGRPVRYKNLVFTVKACQSTGLGGPSPQASAYVVIDSAPPGAEGLAPPPPRQVFKGWMFASSPGLNPFQHPIYDAWLISCMAAVPPA
jgi:hypothetical protein